MTPHSSARGRRSAASSRAHGSIVYRVFPPGSAVEAELVDEAGHVMGRVRRGRSEDADTADAASIVKISTTDGWDGTLVRSDSKGMSWRSLNDRRRFHISGEIARSTVAASSGDQACLRDPTESVSSSTRQISAEFRRLTTGELLVRIGETTLALQRTGVVAQRRHVYDTAAGERLVMQIALPRLNRQVRPARATGHVPTSEDLVVEASRNLMPMEILVVCWVISTVDLPWRDIRQAG